MVVLESNDLVESVYFSCHFLLRLRLDTTRATKTDRKLWLDRYACTVYTARQPYRRVPDRVIDASFVSSDRTCYLLSTRSREIRTNDVRQLTKISHVSAYDKFMLMR